MKITQVSVRKSKLRRYNGDDLPTKEVHWIEPELVAQIGFEEWTDYGKLRQPRFQGLRRDKDPKDVIKETPDS